jgi:hypothetical protein
MNIIDIRTGNQSSIEAIRFSDAGDYYDTPVAIREDGGDLVLLTESDIEDDCGGTIIPKAAVPDFYAALRKAAELGWLPAIDPVKAAAKKVAKKK